MDNFREWLSDNLRYFMLGGAILLIVAVAILGFRACVGSNKGNSESKQQEAGQLSAENNDQGNVPSSPEDDGETNDGKKEDTNPMEKNNAEMTALIKSYYKALGEKDIATLRTLEYDLSPSDEARITNSKDYIEGYEVKDVYSKKGLTEDSYVVYAVFQYMCKGIDTPVPALSQFYVETDSEGKLKIDGGALQDAEITAYTDEMQKDADVAELIAEVQAENEKAQQEDPALAEFLEGLGEDGQSSSVSENGTKLTVIEECNVRESADSEAEIIDVLSAGTEVEKTGQEGEWIQISYDGISGYVHNSLLE
ncbi:SH3 domain-containing protein [Blautia sp. HCP3S3_G3]|uniref:SH3 domain-containing protein n=1 Tax=Blautia sp. HCP3S3_G3 TaxID=3438913 RepID=UPI003F8B9016